MTGLFKSIIEPSAKSVLRLVNGLEPEISALSDEELKQKTNKFREELENGGDLVKIMPEAFAVVREVSRRVLGMRHFDVQVLGGVELARGRIVEMATGEGKTLVATLPVCLQALTGKGVHVVTVNDYLAKRDAEWMGPIYNFLGLTVGCVQEEMGRDEMEENEARKSAYACDVTYGANSELVFDCLRDNLIKDPDEAVHRGFHFAIVDEVDLLLIDEAQTPLIISGESEDDPRFFKRVDKLVRTLNEKRHYKADKRTRTAALTEEGLELVERELAVGSLYTPENLEWMHAVHQSLQANAVYERDVDYIVEDGEVFIVDEHTGRVSPDKRFSDGLHQALEAKERVQIKREDITLAKTSYQHYFRGYEGLCGMTGTAWREREEFRKVYFRKVVRVPTHEPMIRKDYRRVAFRNMAEKHRAVIKEIEREHERGRPLLVGTVSVKESEQLSALLGKRGVPHNILNAKHHQREAEIIAQAGRKGAVTISTNMAGRGTDIMLGGNAAMLAKSEKSSGNGKMEEKIAHYERLCEREREEILELGGLHVIGTGEHESERIDRQLRGRTGRQGDPGSSIFFISPDDPVYKKFGQERELPRLKGYLEEFPEDEALDDKRAESTLDTLRKKVEIENQAMRLDVLKYDTVVHERRETIWKWRRSLLEAVEANEWKNSVRELFQDLLGTLIEEVRCNLNENESEGRGTKEKSEWRLVLEQILGRSMDDEKNDPEDPDSAAEWIHSRYLARFNSDLNEALVRWERNVLLDTIDRLWTDYLTELERIEEGIGLRGYGNLDPIVEFRREAGLLFGNLMRDIELHAARVWLALDPLAMKKDGGSSEKAERTGFSRRGKREDRKRRERATDRLPKIGRGGRRRRKR